MRTTIKILAASALAALLLAIILTGDRGRSTATDPTASPAERSRSRSGAPPGAASEPGRRRPAFQGLRRPALSSSGEGADDAGRKAELEAKGVTPHKLYASRAGGRMTLLAIHARQYGEPELADVAEELGNELWANAEPGGADRDVVALLTRQSELVERFKDLARRHPEDPFFITLVGEVDGDLASTRRGEPRGIDRKLEIEEDEPPRRALDDDEPDAPAGPAPG